MRKLLTTLAVLMLPAGDEAGGAASGEGTPPTPPKADKKAAINGKDLLLEWVDDAADVKQRHKDGKISRSNLKAAFDAAKTAKIGSTRAKAGAEIEAYLAETAKGKGGGPRKWTEDGTALVTVTDNGDGKGVLRINSKGLQVGAVYLPAEVDAEGNVSIKRHVGVVVEGAKPGGDDEDEAPAAGEPEPAADPGPSEAEKDAEE